MFRSVLVANRGEIACRVIRTLRGLGITSIAVHSAVDANARHVAEADISVPLPGDGPADGYLDQDALLAAIAGTGAEAVHPGYGFLSENAEFARRVDASGAVFIGPSPEVVAAMGDKINARNLVTRSGVPVGRGTTEPVRDVGAALAAAKRIGYPVMVKAAGGGGGIGLATASDAVTLAEVFATTVTRAGRAFGSADILLERFVANARHVEVQLFGLADGTVVALGERDCSTQRRHQKVVEETPAPLLDEGVRAAMRDASVRAAAALGYRGAGTIEWLVDPDGSFTFIEMNTRLQVEHTITELVTGLDLVAEQLRVAAGDPPGFDPLDPPAPHGHAMQLRVCAEDPLRFLPGPGVIEQWDPPSGPGVRVDAGYRAGDTVSRYYDSLLAKVCVLGSDRAHALDLARDAVASFGLTGPRHNLPFLAEVLRHPDFVSGRYDTGLVGRMRPEGARR